MWEEKCNCRTVKWKLIKIWLGIVEFLVLNSVFDPCVINISRIKEDSKAKRAGLVKEQRKNWKEGWNNSWTLVSRSWVHFLKFFWRLWLGLHCLLDLCLSCAPVVISQSTHALHISSQPAKSVLLIRVGLLNRTNLGSKTSILTVGVPFPDLMLGCV